MLVSRLANITRNFTTSAVRRGAHGGVPGENLPFGIDNKFKLTAFFVIFFGSGLGAPFFILRHQMTKKM